MFFYIITDKPDNARNPQFYANKLTLEEQAEDVCLMLRYNQVTTALLEQVRPWAVCHSGCSAGFNEHAVLEYAPYRALVCESAIPQIGFCGGHQLLAHFYGSELGVMRPLRADEPDLSSGYHPGQFKEWGIYPVRLLRPDPLFAGLDEVIRVQEYHMAEVKSLSPDLELLASSAHCPVQAFVHREKPVYGVQFHPEHATAQYPDGFQLLRNFFTLAREHHQ